MPLILAVIGIILVVSGIRGTQKQLAQQLKQDFTGQGNFIYWLLSLGLIGSLGYIDDLKTFSRTFMALIIIAMLLSNKGFFTKLNASISSGTAQPAPDQPSQNVTFQNVPSPSSFEGLGDILGSPSASDPFSVLGPLGVLAL